MEAARAGAAFARASWLHSQQRGRELAGALEDVVARTPASLLAPPPDGSAAEVWPRLPGE